MRKLRMISSSLIVKLCLALILPTVTFSQTWSPRYSSMNPNTAGYYEYLPLGYNDPGNVGKKWPVILFIHGVGELGSGSPADLANLAGVGLPGLISGGGFPKTFTVGGQTHSFIVIAPQFKSWPSAADVEACLNYIQANYRADESRLYLSGLSMGGGVTWDYASASSANANRLAAILPICGASSPANYKGQIMAGANLPILATHNQDDGVVGYQSTVQYVDMTNAYGPNPAAIKVIWPSGGHNAWSRTYDPSTILTGSLNAYQWMLQYTRGTAAPPPTPAFTVSISGVNNVNCNGASTGSATATPSGGTAPYTYSWSNGQTTATATNLRAGNYNVTVRDANNNAGYGSVTITEPPLLVLNATYGAITTYGGTTNVTLSATGGTPPYTYGGSPTTNVTAGGYNYTVTDAKGCTATKGITITQPAAPGLSATISSTKNVSCNGGTDGSITVAPSGGLAPYRYEWNTNPMQTTATAANLKAGNYSVTVKDANGTYTIVNATITEPAPLVLNATAGTITTAGGQTNVTLTATGGTAPYTYSGNTQNLTAGTYSFGVTDAKGCTATRSITITEPAPSVTLSATVSSTGVSCNGGTNGTATVTVTSGTAPYSYSWSNGQTTATATNLRAGNYSVTVRDAASNTATYNVSVAEPAQLVLSISLTAPIDVFGGQTSVTLSATGGTAPYTYTGNTNNLLAGTYTYTVTDAKGCTDTKSISITQPPAPGPAPVPALSATVQSITNVSCNGATDGSASLGATGGVTPYTFSWSNGRSGSSVSGLAAGAYVVTIKDAAGTSVTQNVNITEPAKLILSINQPEPITVAGGQTYVTLSATGGTAPYAYTGRTTNLNAGTYSFTVTDAKGCTDTKTVSITEPAPAPAPAPVPALTATTSVVSTPSCNGGTEGSASVEAKGGVSPYTYSWSNGKTTSTVSGLAAGSYTVTVRDAAGTSATARVDISEPAKLVLAISQPEPITVYGGQTYVTLSATGGTAPYNYSGSTTNLNAGTYTFTVTDAKGCTDTRTVTITEPAPVPSPAPAPVPALTLNLLSETSVSCNGQADGSASIETKGGVAPYTYTWSNGKTTSSVTGLGAGTYTVTVKDAAGTTASMTVAINEPAKLVLVVNQPEPIAVNGGQTYVNLSATGGTAPYTYSGQTTNLNAGTYTFTVTDAKGCSDTKTVSIAEPAPAPAPAPVPALVATATVVSTPSCNGGTEGSATVEAKGGVSPYTYHWSNGSTGSSVSGLAAGTYTVTVKDAAGGSVTTNLTISEPARLVLSIEQPEAITVNGGQTYVALTATGGTAPYTYSGKTTNLNAGTYTFTVTDSKGCSDSKTIVISEPAPAPSSPAPSPVPELTASVTVVASPACNGSRDGSLLAEAKGGVAPYSFTWSNGATGASVTGLSAGTYTVFVKDAAGTSAKADVQIAEPAKLELRVAQPEPIGVYGGQTYVVLEAIGGTAPYQYTGSTSNLVAGTYTFTVTDAKGCTDTRTVTITQPEAPAPPPAPAPAPAVDPLVVEASTGTIACYDGTTSVSLRISGGVKPYQVAGDTTDLKAGTYSFTVTDAAGTTATTQVTITQPQPLLLQATGDIIRKIGGTSDVKLEASGGTAPYTYAGETRSLKAGNYSFKVTDANGCKATGAVELKEPAVIVSRFETAAQDTGIALNWVTSYEYQIDHFVVERSVDNVNFSEFRKLKSNWSSVVRFPQYRVMDNTPVFRRNFYKVFAITSFGEKIELESKDVVFENRAKVEVRNMTNMLDITISNPYKEPIEMVLVDMYGRAAKRVRISKESYIWNSKISMQDLPSGMYVLKITGAHVEHAKQVVKVQ